jgi:CheY-like chemotaxis protein
LAISAAQKSLQFVCEFTPSLAERVVGDPARLRQILINLIGNALKFTHEGAIALQVQLEEQSGDDLVLHFTVSDTGIGIAPDKQQSIFEAFTQADTSVTRQYGGTGLGLSIASRLTQKMGGRIWLESEPGRGSTFHFTAKLRVDRSPCRDCPRPEQVSALPLRRLSILVAEDHPVNRQLAARLLEKFGHSALLVTNGMEAVDAFKNRSFDVILMDLQMPEMDGCQATAAIRSMEQERGLPRTPILALTARAMKGDREICLAHGMDGYLAKPIKAEELRQALEQLSSLRTQGPPV